MMLVMIFLAVPGAAGAADIGAILPKVPAEWTYMVYMNGDNNLEKSVVTDIENEYAAYGSNRDINVVILADRSPGYDDREGDWTSTKLFYVQKDIRATAENALSDWGERDMGDPENLAEFITYCKTNFPAKKYALVLWDHGWSWHPGWFMCDETSEEDSLDQEEIAAAMEKAGPVDVVGFDACEMQAMENQALWRNYAKVAVGSEKSVWWRGLENDHIMERLCKNPGMTAEELGVVMAQSLQDKDASAVALGKDWEVMDKEFAVLSGQLLEQMPAYLEEYRLIRKHLHDDFSADSVDVKALCLEVKAHVPDPSMQKQCDKVIAAFDKAVLYDWHKEQRFKDIFGISIFWPNTLDDYIDVAYYQNNLLFTKNNSWGKFIEKYMFSPERVFDGQAAAKKLVELGIFSDVNNLDKVITKSELADACAKLAPTPKEGEINKQTIRDVKASSWYSGAVNLAVSYGYLKAESNGRFEPNKKMTWGDAVVCLLRVLGYEDRGLKGDFPKNYFAKAGTLGLFSKGYFIPGEAITRGDFALLLCNALDLDRKYYDEKVDGYLSTNTSLRDYKYSNDPAEDTAEKAGPVVKVPGRYYYGTVTECFKDSKGKYIRVIEGNGAVADYYFDDIYAALKNSDLTAAENAVQSLRPGSFYGYHPSYPVKYLLDEIADGTAVRLSFDGTRKLQTFTRLNDDREWIVPVGKYYIEDLDTNTGALKISDGVWSGWYTIDKDTALYDWTDDYNLTTLDQLEVGDVVVADPVNFDTENPANQVPGDEGRFLYTGNSPKNILKILVIEN